MEREFPGMDDGERERWAESWIADVSLGHKEVAVCLAPPLCSLGFLTTPSAPRGRKPQVPELRIHLEYDLAAYYRAGVDIQGLGEVRGTCSVSGVRRNRNDWAPAYPVTGKAH